MREGLFSFLYNNLHPSNSGINVGRMRPFSETPALNCKPKLLPPYAKTLSSHRSLSSHLFDQSVPGQKVGVVTAKQKKKIVAVCLIQACHCSYGCTHKSCRLCLQSQCLTPLFTRAPDNHSSSSLQEVLQKSKSLSQLSQSARVSEECTGRPI